MNSLGIPEILQPGQLATQSLPKINEIGIVPKAVSNAMIVCVDDNMMNLYSLKLMLQLVGFVGEVKCFQSSKRALDFVVTQSIQLM